MLLRVVIVLAGVLPILSATIPSKQRIVLEIDTTKASSAANAVMYTATSDQVTIFLPSGAPEDSRIVSSRTNSFIINKEGYDKFSAAFKKVNRNLLTTVIL